MKDINFRTGVMSTTKTIDKTLSLIRKVNAAYTSWLIILIYSIIIITPIDAKCAQANLLLNGDVETEGSANYPVYWTSNIDSGNATQSWDTDKCVSTTHSVKTVMNSDGQADWRQLVNGISDNISYRFRAHVYASNVTGGSHSAELHWFDENDNYLGRNQFTSNIANAWIELTGEDIVPPDGAVKVYVMFRTYKTGTYYFDDAVLLRKDNNLHLLDGKFPVGIYTVPSLELLNNNDFEKRDITNGNMPVCWSKNIDSGNAVQSWNTDRCVSSSHSVKTVMNSDGLAYWQQPVMGICDAISYKFKVNIYATNVSSGSHSAELQWYDANNNYLDNDVLSSTTADTWIQTSIQDIVPPTGAVKVCIVLKTSKTGTYYFDDISFEVDWTTEDRYNDIRSAGFNFAINALGISNFKSGKYMGDLMYLPSGTDPTLLENTINSIENYSSLALWYGPDEPAWRDSPLTVAGVVNGYDKVLETDDYYSSAPHKVWLNHAPRGTKSDPTNYALLKDYSAGADIVSMDIYPVPGYVGHSNLTNKTISCVGEYTDILYNDVVSWNSIQQKPIWMVLQGFSWGDLPDADIHLTHAIELQWFDVNDNYLGRTQLSSTTADTWIEVKEEDISPPAGAVKAWVLLRTYKTGTYYFDDISLIENSTNLIANSDLETEGSAGWPASWSGVAGQQSWDTTRYVSATHSVKTVMSSDGILSWRQLVTGIDVTKKYNFTGHIYATNVDMPSRPTWLQTRFMAYDAVIHGAGGVVYWGTNYISVISDLWLSLKNIAAELRELSVVLTSPAPFRTVNVSNSAIETLLCEYQADLYLIAANKTAYAANNVTINISGLPLTATMKFFDGESGTIICNSLTDNFDSYQVRVYRIRKERNLIANAGCWHLDETTSDIAADTSTNDNHGTLVDMDTNPASPGFCRVDGKIGKALDFDGVDDYVDCGSNDSLNITDKITIEGWIRPTAYNPVNSIIGRQDWTDSYWVFYGGGYEKIAVNLEGVVSYSETWTDGFTVNEWHHFAVTYDKDGGTGNLKIYRDGTLINSLTKTGAIGSAATSLRVGGKTGTGGGYHFNGTLDEIAVYSRALSADEIYQCYLDGDTCCSLHFDEGEGTIAADTSSAGNYGTLIDMDINPASVDFYWVDGKIGKALDFDGVDDYVDCGSNDSLNITDKITIEGWIRPTAYNPVNSIIGRQDWTDSYWVFYGGGYEKIAVNLEGVVSYSETWTDGFTVNEWHHFAVTYDKDGGTGNLKIYRDGTLVNSLTKTGAIGSAATSLRVGGKTGTGGGYHFNGTLDEIAVYSRALSADEIYNHYYEGL